MEFQKISATSLKDLFIKQIQGLILSGELPLGSKLPSERELAAKMQVSRAVVNSGLTELATQGFLEIIPRKGVFVADYRKRGNINTLMAMMQFQNGVLGKDEIRSVLEVRIALEHLAVSSAIKKASDEEINSLGKHVSALAASASYEEAANHAFAFQHELALISQNSILPLFYYSFQSATLSLWIKFCSLYGIRALSYNTETLYRCIKDRDEKAAMDWTNQYLKEVINGSQQIYME